MPRVKPKAAPLRLTTVSANGPVMNEHVDDHALIRRIAGADQRALEALFLRHQTQVFRFIARITRSEAVAEELTNEVFLDVWRHAGSYQGRSSPATWLLSIAHNRAVSGLRKRREEPWNEDAAAGIPDAADDSEVVVQKADKGRVMQQCINRLSPEYREILDLVYYHDLSIGEVSTVVGIPEGTVKTRLFKARKRLAELLAAAGVDRGWP